MADESSPVPDEVLASATDLIEEDQLTLADNEEVLNALSELTPVFENERSYFVLGNYDREPIRRLNLVVDRLNRRPDAYAFRMVDVKGEWDNSNLAAHSVHRSEYSRPPSGLPRYSRSSVSSPTWSPQSSASPRKTRVASSSSRVCSPAPRSTSRRAMPQAGVPRRGRPL